MTGQQIKKLRRALGENRDTFGDRFGVLGRTVEHWEQGRRKPNRWVLPMILELQKENQQKARR